MPPSTPHPHPEGFVNLPSANKTQTKLHFCISILDCGDPYAQDRRPSMGVHMARGEGNGVLAPLELKSVAYAGSFQDF